jgi:MFS family permease
LTVSLPARPEASGVKPLRVSTLLALLTPTALALYANFQGVQAILAPERIEDIDAVNKIGHLAVLTTIGAVTGVLGLALGGAASDATRGRFGRRAPWLVAMALASAALTLALGLQTTLIGVMAAGGALWFTLNFYQAALLATNTDRVPERRRTLASSLLGISGPLGAMLGVNLAAAYPNILGHAALAAMLIVMTAVFVSLAPEPPHRPAPRREQRGGWNMLASFGSRDFALAFAFRVLMFLGQFSINNYLFYILQDHIRSENPGVATGELNALRTCVTIVAAFATLWLVNRTSRRRLFAQSFALIMAAGMLIPAFYPNWRGMLAFAALSGLASGVYSAVDLPLMQKLLPHPDNAGRDLALLVMAGAAAQFLAPWIGGGVIAHFGYDTLFVVAAFITLLSGLAMSMIRRVS